MIEIKYYDFDNTIDFDILSIKNIMKFSVWQLNSSNNGEIQSIIQTGVSGFSTYIKIILFTILPTIVYMIVALVWLSTISIKIMFIALIFSAGTIIYLLYLNNISKEDFFILEGKKQKMNAFRVEIINNIPFIKNSSQDAKINELYKSESMILKNDSINTWWPFVKKARLTDILYVTVMIFVFYFGSESVLLGEYTVGKFIVLFSWISNILNRSSGLKYSFKRMIMIKPSIEKYLDLISQPVLISENGNIEKISYGSVAFESISYSFNKKTLNETNALSNVSFKLKVGESLAVVGVSGSGKSTLVNLLMRAYESDSGGIFIDNLPLDLYASTYRKSISYIEQSPKFFARSIRFNILFGVSNKINDDEIFKVLDMVGLKDKILSFDDQLDSLIVEGGRNFSGGEIQRLAIANMLLRKSKIMILDEATSALDEMSQKQVQKAIQIAGKKTTSIIIAHRLTTISHCDKVLVLDRGKVEFFGNYKDAVRKSVIFKQMLNESNHKLQVV